MAKRRYGWLNRGPGRRDLGTDGRNESPDGEREVCLPKTHPGGEMSLRIRKMARKRKLENQKTRDGKRESCGEQQKWPQGPKEQVGETDSDILGRAEREPREREWARCETRETENNRAQAARRK